MPLVRGEKYHCSRCAAEIEVVKSADDGIIGEPTFDSIIFGHPPALFCCGRRMERIESIEVTKSESA